LMEDRLVGRGVGGLQRSCSELSGLVEGASRGNHARTPSPLTLSQVAPACPQHTGDASLCRQRALSPRWGRRRRAWRSWQLVLSVMMALNLYGALAAFGSRGALGSFGPLIWSGALTCYGPLIVLGSLGPLGSLHLVGTLVEDGSLHSFGTLSVSGSHI